MDAIKEALSLAVRAAPCITLVPSIKGSESDDDS
jgi:hypothetical protein